MKLLNMERARFELHEDSVWVRFAKVRLVFGMGSKVNDPKK